MSTAPAVPFIPATVTPIPSEYRPAVNPDNIAAVWEVLQSTYDHTLTEAAAAVLPPHIAAAATPDNLRLFLLKARPHCHWAFLNEAGFENEAEGILWDTFEAWRNRIMGILCERTIVTSTRRIERLEGWTN